MNAHETVLLHEAVDALVYDPDGSYVDCTYGRGGHSALIAERISAHGRLLVIDKDVTAIAHAQEQFADDARVRVMQGDFSSIAQFMNDTGLPLANGILMDLGVSSPQLDEAERGFSFMRDGPLDMRMDVTTGLTASEWLHTAEERDISMVLLRLGEEKFARRIAKHIVEYRKEANIDTTATLVRIIESAVPRREKHKHPATRSFQAIRIHINGELTALQACLDQVVELLTTGGRLVVISFHSLEDRIVKRFIRTAERGPQLPSRLPIRDADIDRKLKSVGKAVRASDAEVAANVRSRSAIMRVAEKL